jgi:hypothetical protein
MSWNALLAVADLPRANAIHNSALIMATPKLVQKAHIKWALTVKDDG